MNKALNSSKLFFNRYVTGKTNSPKGEDEVVARILDEIGIKCTFCVEIGAGDGVTESVTHLFREQGSDSLLIDAAVAPELTPTGKMPSNPYKTSAGVSIESVKNNANNVKIEAVSAENINNIFDLLWKLPKAYTDRSLSTKVKDLKIGENQTVTIVAKKYLFPRIRKLPNRVKCSDETGELDCVFFNSYEGYIKKILPLGKEITVSGKISYFKNKYQITSPKYISEGSSLIKQVHNKYSLTDGISEKFIIKLLNK